MRLCELPRHTHSWYLTIYTVSIERKLWGLVFSIPKVARCPLSLVRGICLELTRTDLTKVRQGHFKKKGGKERSCSVPLLGVLLLKSQSRD